MALIKAIHSKAVVAVNLQSPTRDKLFYYFFGSLGFRICGEPFP